MLIVLFPIWVYVYALFFKINYFSKPLLDSCHNYKALISKTVAHIKLFLVMVLNLYLTSEWSQSKYDFFGGLCFKIKLL